MRTIEEMEQVIVELATADDWDVGSIWTLYDLEYSLQQDEETEDVTLDEIMMAIRAMIAEGKAVLAGIPGMYGDGVEVYTAEFGVQFIQRTRRK